MYYWRKIMFVLFNLLQYPERNSERVTLDLPGNSSSTSVMGGGFTPSKPFTEKESVKVLIVTL